MLSDMKTYITEFPFLRYLGELCCCGMFLAPCLYDLNYSFSFYPCLLGVMQQPMIQQYKISQNQVHGSPGSNYQQTAVPQSPSG